VDLRELENLGEPNLEISCLRVWVHGREFPDSQDFWDGNWLRVTARCTTKDTSVRAFGSLIHLREIGSLFHECSRLYEKLEGCASLDCMEPNLTVKLTAGRCGHVDIEINITPDHMSESHTFIDMFDQTYLPPIIAGCKAILEEYPVRQAKENLPSDE